MLIAKIERAEAVEPEVLVDIMSACDGIMVARGDLAVEVGDASVPALQKRMIRLAREQNKLTITATQMMESMIASPVPTRAEVSDVANAVLDGTDAVMLSAESASGKYPVETIEAMDRICVEAEQTQPVSLDAEFLNRVFTRVDQSIAMAGLFTAFHLKVKAIATLTESGSTALWMSRLNCGVPIYALTSQTPTRYRCALFRDVYPLMVKYVGNDREDLLARGGEGAAGQRRGERGRPDRAHHRRADRQGRRHQHDEDREGRRATPLTHSPAAPFYLRATRAPERLEVLRDGAALGVVVEQVVAVLRVQEALRDEFLQRRGALAQKRRDRLLARIETRRERRQHGEEDPPVGDHPLVMRGDPGPRRDLLHRRKCLAECREA